MVLVDDLLASSPSESLDALMIPFPSLRGEVCSRFGGLHAFDGRMEHQTDRICADHRTTGPTLDEES